MYYLPAVELDKRKTSGDMANSQKEHHFGPPTPIEPNKG